MSSLVAASDSSQAKRKADSLTVDVASESNVARPAKITPTNAEIDVSGLSPYKARMKVLEQSVKSANCDYIRFGLGPFILEAIPGKLDELDVDDVDDLSKEQIEEALDSLTEEQVKQYDKVIVVPRSVAEGQRKFSREIMAADPRNDMSGSFVMLNTYSSWCMYPVINKGLSAATREINKAIKAVQAAEAAGAQPVAGVAADAFQKTLATVLACDEMDHWRVDTESPEDCEKIGKKVSKLLKDLFWFTDAELGIVDPWSRSILLSYFEEDMSRDWSDLCGSINVKTAKNGKGLDRTHAAAPAAKKPKVSTAAASASAAAAPAMPAGSASASTALVQYLYGIAPKLNQRVKTVLQIKIASAEEPSKSDMVVLSGATDLKKLNQLCAYITGHSQVFEYHSQRGTCMKGSRLELRFNDGVVWLAEKGAKKQADKDGAAHAVDKSLKIVQLFQGLNMSSTSGIVFDSDMARSIATTPGSVSWVSPDGKRYNISVQAIVAQKSMTGKMFPMPRLVKYFDDYQSHAKTGFGKPFHKTNRDMKGDRNGPHLWIFGDVTKSQLAQMHAKIASEPLCSDNGSFGGGGDRFDGPCSFEPADVQTAGPPSSVAN